VNISTSLGSIEKNSGGGVISYRVSKAALNMLTSNWAIDYPGIAFLPIHPGWVDTDMGRASGGKPPLVPEESIKGILSVVEKATLENSGKFVQWDGKPLPW